MTTFLTEDAQEQAPIVRPKLNIGFGLDIVHGEMARGLKGDIHVNGGMPNMGGGTAIGNGGKTELALNIWGRVTHRYTNSTSRIDDCELTLGLPRIQNTWMRNRIDESLGIMEWMDFQDDPKRFVFTDRTTISCSKHHKSVLESAKKRLSDKKALVDTPFRDRDGKPMKYYNPHFELVDSFSAYTPDQVEIARDKTDAGDSGRNMEALTINRIKTQMLSELLVATAKAGIYYYFTAHLGEQHQLDPYKPNKEKLAALKNGLKMKDVPEKTTFYPGIFWWCCSSRPLLDSNNKPLFPDPENDYQNDTKSVDLQEITITALRNKSGPTGDFKVLVMSQTRGLSDSLTNFYNCLKHNRFGIMGKDGNASNLVHFYMELYPECSLTRQKVESKAEADPRLMRAIVLTSELLDVYKYWSFIPRHWKCTPADLYKDIKEKGYDWNELLDTRGYWTYDHYEREDKGLTIIDLLRMRVGEYHPWWMENKDAKAETGKSDK